MNKEVEYLKEHLYEIYKYKKSMKDLTYDMDIEHLLRTCKALDYSQKEIERLNNNWNELRKWVVNNKHNENTKERYLVVDYGTLLGKMGELKGSEKSERTNFR